MDTNIKEYLKNEISENKLSHAFLVTTNNVIKSQNDIYMVLKNNGIILNEEMDNNVSIMSIKPEKNLIDKNKILDLQKFIITKSTLSKYKIYFIINAELMNIYASNKLLKVLEEPSDNVIGFLITTSENAILPTIKSRCTHIYNYYKEEEKNEYEEIIQKLLMIKTINYKHYINLKQEICSKEKQEILSILNGLKNKTINNLTNNVNIKELANSYKILDNIISLITSNVNVELCLDKMFIEMRK